MEESVEPFARDLQPIKMGAVRRGETTVIRKGIVIGKKAEMLKRVGSAAREELEAAMNSKVFLKLEVKVDPKWPQRFAS